MAVGMFRSVDNVKHKIKKRYRSVDNITREIKKRWRSVDNVARLTFKSAEFEFVWEDDNNGLATAWVEDVNTSYPKLNLNTGKIDSAAYLRVYGDFSGKKIVIDGARDTDGYGGVSFYKSDGTPLGTSAFTDDFADGRDSFGPYDDCAYMTLGVRGSTSTKSRTMTLTHLTLDGENVMPELVANAADLGWTVSPY